MEEINFLSMRPLPFERMRTIERHVTLWLLDRKRYNDTIASVEEFDESKSVVIEAERDYGVANKLLNLKTEDKKPLRDMGKTTRYVPMVYSGLVLILGLWTAVFDPAQRKNGFRACNDAFNVVTALLVAAFGFLRVVSGDEKYIHNLFRGKKALRSEDQLHEYLGTVGREYVARQEIDNRQDVPWCKALNDCGRSCSATGELEVELRMDVFEYVRNFVHLGDLAKGGKDNKYYEVFESAGMRHLEETSKTGGSLRLPKKMDTGGFGCGACEIVN